MVPEKVETLIDEEKAQQVLADAAEESGEEYEFQFPSVNVF
jgi:hypothetical protein